jgi:cytochrome b subunit of formate dehydrogenase
MDPRKTEPRYYSRFSPIERYLHVVLIATFLGLAMTGMPLRFSDAGWAVRFSHMVGGFAAILFFHKLCAVTLTAVFLIHVGNVVHRGVIKREKGIFWGPSSMVPQPRDFRDLFAHLRWFLWLGPRPKFDHFAYWEKFDYWAVFWGMAIIGFSGYAMWFPRLFARFFPGSALNVLLLLHGEEALLAIWFIFTVHFFNTHLRPDSFPMDLVIFTGRLTEEELKKKHPAEYQRLQQKGMLQAAQAGEPVQRLKVFGRVVGILAVSTGFVLLWLTLTSFLKGR